MGAMAETGVDFGVLGPLQVTVGGDPLPLGTPKQRAVLAVLVINRNRPVGIESLITAAWEEWPPPGARASLHTYVSNLRRLLGTEGSDSRTALISKPPGSQLSISDADCDLGRFVTGKTVGVQEAAAGRFEQASRHLSAALAEWRGPVLEDLRDFAFVDPFATALMEDKLLAHTGRAEAEIACGRGYAVIGELESLTVAHPYREPLWAQLMTAYYLADRQSDALDAYRRLKTTLADDLGIDPGPTVYSLYERILRQERLDVKQAAKTTAADTLVAMGQRTGVGTRSTVARLRDGSGHSFALLVAVTRIGRLADNDIVLDDAKVSRHHAVVIDTGAGLAISDLRSANGVEVAAVAAPLLFLWQREGAQFPGRPIVAVAAVLLAYPALFYVNAVDAYISHNLYSANTASAKICRGGKCSGAVFDTWDELNVPVPPEPRLFRQWFDIVCDPGDVLVITGKRTRVTGRPSIYTETCTAGSPSRSPR
jgi:SARP family transcriptional regulator, regulator of embCAB operon